MNPRSQSAIEFITTYGWAIVAVVVAIGVLYSLGIFNLGGNTATGCTVVEGFSCTKPILSSAGLLTMQLGQVGSIKTITATGCSRNETQPTPGSWSSTYLTLQSGQKANLTFNCPGISGGQLGAIYSGTLWIQYVVVGGSGGGSSGTATIQVGTFKIPATTEPSATYLWVGTINGGVYVLNETSYATVNTLSIGGTIYSITFNPTGSLAYIASGGPNLITTVSTSTFATVNTVTLSGVPSKSGLQYSQANNLLYLLSGQAHVASYTLNPGNYTLSTFSPPYAVGQGALNPSSTDIFFINATAFYDASLQGYGLQSASLSGYTVMGENPSGTAAFATTFGSGSTVKVIATPGGGTAPSVINSIGLLDNYPTSITFDPTGTFAYVTTEQTNPGYVDVVLLASNAVQGHVAVGQTPWAVAFNPVLPVAYVANENGASVSVVNTQLDSVITTISLPGSHPYAIAVQPT
jgi:YVTN family beta-propeller protein